MKGGNSSGRPHYPGVADRIGEDPARYLTVDMDVLPRIRGIQDLGVINGWLSVARDIGVEQRVLDQLERRQSFLVDRQRRIATDGGER